MRAQQARTMAWTSVREVFRGRRLPPHTHGDCRRPTLHDLIERDPSAVLGSLPKSVLSHARLSHDRCVHAPHAAGLPLSLQVAGPVGSDVGVLQVAEAVPQVTGHRLLRPPLFRQAPLRIRLTSVPRNGRGRK
jgi:hypothetical protein